MIGFSIKKRSSTMSSSSPSKTKTKNGDDDKRRRRKKNVNNSTTTVTVTATRTTTTTTTTTTNSSGRKKKQPIESMSYKELQNKSLEQKEKESTLHSNIDELDIQIAQMKMNIQHLYDIEDPKQCIQQYHQVTEWNEIYSNSIETFDTKLSYATDVKNHHLSFLSYLKEFYHQLQLAEQQQVDDATKKSANETSIIPPLPILNNIQVPLLHAMHVQFSVYETQLEHIHEHQAILVEYLQNEKQTYADQQKELQQSMIDQMIEKAKSNHVVYASFNKELAKVESKINACNYILQCHYEQVEKESKQRQLREQEEHLEEHINHTILPALEEEEEQQQQHDKFHEEKKDNENEEEEEDVLALSERFKAMLPFR